MDSPPSSRVAVQGAPDGLIGWVVLAVSCDQRQGCWVFDDGTEDQLDAVDGKDTFEYDQDAYHVLQHELMVTTNEAHGKVRYRVATKGVELFREPHLHQEDSLNATRASVDCHDLGQLALGHGENTQNGYVSLASENVPLLGQDKE